MYIVMMLLTSSNHFFFNSLEILLSGPFEKKKEILRIYNVVSKDFNAWKLIVLSDGRKSIDYLTP